MSSQVQQYMRETLKKLYLKNRSEDHPCASMRQSDQPTMIRELLINIENIKDFQNSQGGQCYEQSPDYAKENGKELLLAFKNPTRKLHHMQHGKHVLDINEEAEKAYRGRPIHQGNLKHPAVKAQ